MHPVVEFYLEQRKSHDGFTLQELWRLSPNMIGNAYFYIPWLFPVKESSKWNKNVPVFTQEDAIFFRNNAEIQHKFLKSFDVIINYFGIHRINSHLYVSDIVKERPYWLRNIGHESKKISRIIRSLAQCGQLELSRNLLEIAFELGKEKGIIQLDTLTIWETIREEIKIYESLL